MSVRTAADEKLDEARAHIDDAVKLMYDITLGENANDRAFSDEYMKGLDTIYDGLVSAQRKLRT